MSDVIILSRVRLARNLKKYNFTSRLDNDKQLIDECKNTILDLQKEINKGLKYIDTTNIGKNDKQCYIEKHLISPEFANKKQNTGLIVSDDEKLSIMINEEDHLRIQALYKGLQLENAWQLANGVDDAIDSHLEYAYDDRLGYLTSCPTNVGTGMRASVMIHLPALTLLGYIKGIVDMVSKVGITVRGIYGEGTKSVGNFYQISNQVSLGQSELEIIDKVNNIANKIVEQEKFAREKLMKNRIEFEDKIYRSYGVFKNARIMDTAECMRLLSDIRLGVDLGIIKDLTIEQIDELMLLTQPANLQKTLNSELSPEDRDIKRAEIIRSKLGGI